MLEMLLIITALTGNQESFNKSSEAYYKYQKYDVVVEKVGKDNPILAQVVGAIGLANTKKLYFKVRGPWDLELATDKYVAWFKKEF